MYVPICASTVGTPLRQTQICISLGRLALPSILLKVNYVLMIVCRR